MSNVLKLFDKKTSEWNHPLVIVLIIYVLEVGFHSQYDNKIS